jgi:hypothetical protein
MRYFVARFRRLTGLAVLEDKLSLSCDLSRNAVDEVGHRGNKHREASHHRVRELHGPVLVRIGELADPLKEVSSAGNGFVERLEFFEFGPIRGCDVFPIPARAPLYGVRIDGELNAARVIRLDTLEVTHGELPCEVVERTAEIVDRVPRDQTPVIADFYDLFNTKDDRALFAIKLAPQGDYVRVGMPCLPDSPQVVDVHLSARDLSPGAFKI